MTPWNCLPVFSLCVAPTNRVQAIVAAPDLAKEYSQQIVETEHLFKALLEQPNGLARRILSKAGSDATRLLERTDAFVKRQAKVSGDAAQVGLAVLVAVDASCCKTCGYGHECWWLHCSVHGNVKGCSMYDTRKTNLVKSRSHGLNTNAGAGCLSAILDNIARPLPVLATHLCHEHFSGLPHGHFSQHSSAGAGQQP